jgi:4-amino-4-deoxy-L-arabinose transferase-like glycosyltransferase
LLMAVGVLMGMPWLVNPLLAMVTVLLMVRLGLFLFPGRKTALLAAVLTLSSPYYLLMSGSMMVHPAELFWTVLFLTAWVYWLRGKEQKRWLLVAGVALGMVLLTRQVTAVTVGGAALGLPLLAALTGRFGWERFMAGYQGRRRFRVLAGGVGVVGLMALPFWLLLLGYQWAVTGDPLQDPRLISRPFDRPGFGLDVAGQDNAFVYEEVEGKPAVVWYLDPELPPRGHTLARGLFNTFQNWEALQEHLFGWLPFLTLAFCWLVFVVGRPSFGDWLLLAVLGAVVSVYVSYWAAGIMYGPRYYYAALPAFLLLTARGVVVLGRRLGGRSGRWAAVGVLAVVIGGNLLFYLPETVAESRGFNFVSGGPLAAVEAAVDGEAVVFVSAPQENWWEYGQFFSANTPWLDGRIIYARDLGQENGRLLALYPGRAAYCWDGEVGTLRPFPC